MTAVSHGKSDDIEIKRNCAYFLALLCEGMEFHDAIAREGGIEVIIELASLEDIECQEYAAFSLAHLESHGQAARHAAGHEWAVTHERGILTHSCLL